MDKAEQTKLRILREAVQDNLNGGRKITPTASRRRKPWLTLLLSVSFLTAGAAYLTVSSKREATGRDTPAAAVAHFPTPVESPQLSTAVQDEVPGQAPQPLNPDVVPLAIKKVIIDPGHGGRQTGAISESGVSEKEITLDIALRLHRLLKDSPFEVMLTRQKDHTLPLDKRVAFANENRADIFVSIHVNWMEPRDIRPLETYYVGPSDDPAIIELAALENKDSGYSMSDYRLLLEKIYLDARRHESYTLAKSINANLYKSLRAVNPALENRGVKMAPFVVLVGTEMPAILVEVSSLSNEEDVSLLTNGDYREKIAMALVKGIHAYARKLNGAPGKGS